MEFHKKIYIFISIQSDKQHIKSDILVKYDLKYYDTFVDCMTFTVQYFIHLYLQVQVQRFSLTPLNNVSVTLNHRISLLCHIQVTFPRY